MEDFDTDLTVQLQSRSLTLVIIETSVMVFINLAALCGNFLVCWAIYKNPRLRTIPNIYVVSLAISDILMATLSIPYSCVVLATGGWVFGRTFCQIQGFFTFFLAFVSLQTMTATAVNRYFTVVKPNTYRTSKFFTVRFTIYLEILVCVSASVGAGLAFLWAEFTLHSGKVFCFPKFNSYKDQRGYIAFVDIFYILLSLMILSFCYLQIFRVVRAHKKSLVANSGRRRVAGLSAHLTVSEIKVTKLLFATVLAFTTCWTPIVLIDLSAAILAPRPTNLPRQMYLVYIYLGYGSSSINPIIYGIMNNSFRMEFLKFVPCLSNRVHPTAPQRQSSLVMNNASVTSAAKVLSVPAKNQHELYVVKKI